MPAHPVHSDFRLSEPVDCYVNNLENGVILSYINDEIKIVAIQKSVLYNDGNLIIILSAFVLLYLRVSYDRSCPVVDN